MAWRRTASFPCFRCIPSCSPAARCRCASSRPATPTWCGAACASRSRSACCMIQEGDEAGEVATTADRRLHRAHRGFRHARTTGCSASRASATASSACCACGAPSDGLNMGEVHVARRGSRRCALPAEYARLGDRGAARDRRARRAISTRRAKLRRCRLGGRRLAELLPIDLDEKQALLEIEDPIGAPRGAGDDAAGSAGRRCQVRI